MGDERPRMIDGVLAYTAKDIHDDVASGMDPDCMFVSHEKHDTLRAQLTHTRAESLRVVSDGDPVPVSALGAGDLMHCDYPGIWQKRGDPAAGLTYIVRLDTEIPQGTALTHAALVQPVRLENWEGDE